MGGTLTGSRFQSRSSGLIVEFLGTPGAGKTTLASSLIELLRENGIQARSVVEAARPYALRTIPGEVVNRLAPRFLQEPLLWQVFYVLSIFYGFRFILQNPQFTQQVLVSQMQRPVSLGTLFHALYWLYHQVGYYQFLKTYSWPGEALVFDEGFIHRVVQLNASDVEDPDPNRISAYVDLLPEPDLIIRPIAPSEVCEERVYSRGVWPRFRRKSRQEVSGYFSNAETVVKMAAEHVKSKSWKIIEVDNGSEDPARAQAELHRKFTEIHGSGYRNSNMAFECRSTTVPSRFFYIPRLSRISNAIHARFRTLDIDLEAVTEVLQQYRLEITHPPQNLPFGRRGRNVLVNTPAGVKVLKLYRPQWQIEGILFEHSILDRLTQGQFPALELVTTPGGSTFVTYADRNYALYHFMPGENYSSSYLLRAHRLKLMSLAGSTLARFHLQLQDFLPEGRHHLGFSSYTGPRWRDMAWHVNKVEKLTLKSEKITGREERAQAEWLAQSSSSILEELTALDKLLSSADLPRLVIHGDYGIHNLLIRNANLAMPIDFELSRLEWRLIDLVSCLGKLRYAGNDYDLESMQAFMQAYAGEFRLSAEERYLLPAVWRFYRLQAALQYWNSYFETNGPLRKLLSARDAINQAGWAISNKKTLIQIFSPGNHLLSGSFLPRKI
jgi:Ser/Thr protein kinase RdoA (MazF antagonist)